MKRIAILTIALLSFLCANAQKYSTTAPTGQTLYFTIYDNTARITFPGNSSSDPYLGYVKPSGSLQIPDSVTMSGIKYPVLYINSRAFYECQNLTSVTIPNAVLNIGDYAFYGCSNLSSANIPTSITSISTCAFEYCSKLQSIIIPNKSFYISFGSFGHCGIKSLTIPSNLSSIQCDAFRYCDSLTTLYYNADSLTITAGYSGLFVGCNSLDTVTIGSNVRYLPYGLFKQCVGISEITIPANIKRIGDYVFQGCTGLSTVNLYADSLPLYNTTGEHAYQSQFVSCTNFDTLNVYSGVTAIMDYSFKGCTSLSVINLPIGLNVIRYGAFEGCSSITSFQCPLSVTQIGPSAFKNCVNLLAVSLPGISTISTSLFEGCLLLSDVTIPSTVKNIGTTAFARTNIDTLWIPDSVQTINTGAFYQCPSLSYVHIPYSVQSIGNGAFEKCVSLSSVFFNASNCILSSYNGTTFNGVTYHRVFDSCSNLNMVTFGDSVRTIPNTIFYNCTSLTTANISNSVHTIGSGAFSDCVSLTSIILPDSITTIPSGLFYNCQSLPNINIPNAVDSIHSNAFYGCSSLETITIPENVASIGSGAFANCSNLDDIYVLTETPPSEVYNNNYYYYPTSYPCPTFFNTYNHTLFHIPCGTTSLYQSSWQSWYNYSEPSVDYAYTVNSSDSLIGNVGIIRDIRCQDSSIVILATLTDTHYHFSHWSNGNLANPDTLYLTSDSTVTAIFERNQYIVTANGNDTTMGYVSGGNAYLYQDTALLTAIPFEHYHFVQWSDGDTTNPRQIVVYSDTLHTAIFAPDTYHIDILSNNNIQGSVTGSGNYPYGTPVSVSATANTGYHFTNWSNGNTSNSCVLYLTCDSIIIAFFDRNQYTLTVQSNNTNYGSVEGSGQYSYQDTAILTASAMEHYHFVHWNDGNTDNPRQYVVVDNITLTATFAIDTHIVSVSTNNIAYGGIEGSGDYAYGTPCTVSATAYTGYHFSQWSNGITANPYTFAVLQDTELTAIFEQDGTQGISNVIEDTDYYVYSRNGRIFVESEGKDNIMLFDVNGRIIARKQESGVSICFDIPVSGVYLVKVGDHPARKIVVIK